MFHKIKSVIAAALVAMAVVALPAAATTPAMDFSGILANLDGATAVTAIIAAAAILAVVGFAKWGAKKVASFFG